MSTESAGIYVPYLLVALFVVAVLYSSVGHGGASGYLAILTLVGFGANVTRPSALLLNVFVASIAAEQFYRVGFFAWRIFWPFAAASIPFSFIGGTINLPLGVYKIVLGAVLIAAAARLAIKLKSTDEPRPVNVSVALAIGAVIGLLSGLVGVGGGIFLTPILLLRNWAETRTAAAISAMFIVVNSIAGLFGNYKNVAALPTDILTWLAAAILGGVIGSWIGAKRFDSLMLRRVLALVLVFAGVKLIFV